MILDSQSVINTNVFNLMLKTARLQVILQAVWSAEQSVSQSYGRDADSCHVLVRKTRQRAQ